MVLAFGFAFELPLVIGLLNLTGIMSHARFRKWRRLILFAVFNLQQESTYQQPDDGIVWTEAPSKILTGLMAVRVAEGGPGAQAGIEPGDLLVLLDAGAYGMAQARNYNSRQRAAEVLVEGDKVRLIRRREAMADLLATEIL